MYNSETFIDFNSLFYHDENNNLIDNKALEFTEQELALKYIKLNDVVLELGARYGTVSVIISQIIGENGKLVVVEPDHSIIPSLIKNRDNNNSHFEILDKVISNKPINIIYEGYGTRVTDGEDYLSTISYDDFKKKYPYNFNVLVVDCEGCFEDFLNIMGSDLNNINKIFLETDQAHMCNYNYIFTKLSENGFKVVENINNFHYYLERV